MKMKFKQGDVVRIKKEFCNGPAEENSFYVIVEAYDNTTRYKIGLIGAKELGHPLGLTEIVDEQCLYRAEKIKKTWTVIYKVGNSVRKKQVKGITELDAIKAAKVKNIIKVYL